MKKGLLVSVIVIAVLGLTFGMVMVSAQNTEVRIRKAAEAQQEACKVTYDETWKVIKQLAGVSDKYAEEFKAIYIPLMEKRYDDGGGKMMKWVQERNPTFDTSLYAKLANAIEGKRAGFTREQKRLIDLKREHDTLLEVFPSRLFVGGRPAIEIQVITSGKTKETFATGEENDVDVF